MYKIIFFIVVLFIPTQSLDAFEEYFLTLRNDKVNLRQGPSFEYPVKLFYEKKFLPVLIQDKFENFRKIRDHENNTGWVHISQLSIEDDQLIYNKPSVYSKPSVILKKGRLCKIKKCKKEWCKVQVDNFKGWIKKNSLWGLL